MIHQTEGMLQAYLDGELAAVERATVVRHVEGCPACAAELRALRAAAERFSAALRSVDRAPPVEAARAAVLWRTRGARPAAARRAVLRAAALAGLFASAAAAALPQSPLRRWAVERWAGLTAGFEDEARPAAPVAPPAAAAPAGVSILPSAGRMHILLVAVAPEARVRLRLVDDAHARAVVYADGGAAEPRFRTGPDRIEVAGVGPGEVRIELPRALEYASVEVDGRVYLVKEGDDLRFLAPADSVGAEVVFQAAREIR